MLRVEQIGDCTLYLADCLEVMPGLAPVDLVLADPPYGITQNKWDSIISLNDLWKAIPRRDNTPVIMTASQPFTSALVMSNPHQFKYDWIWEKTKATGHLNAKKMPMKAHEEIVVFAAGPIRFFPQKTAGKPYKPSGGKSKLDNYGDFKAVREGSMDGSRYPRTVQLFNHESKPVHPTQKPVALMEYLIRTYTSEGDAVLDFCMGSGTTGIACQNTNRKFIGIELNEEYFDISVERMRST